MNNRKKILVIGVLLLCLGLIRLTSSEREITQVERIIADALNPVQQTMMEGTNKILTFVEGVSRYPMMKEENEQLKSTLAQIEYAYFKEEECYYENIRLRRLLDMPVGEDYELVAADVIGRSIKSWDDEIIINKGESDGMALHDGVMTYHGLVGKIHQISDHSAKVRLLNNRLASVAAMTERTRFPGVIEGIGDGSGWLQLTYLPYDAPVDEGANVISSGLGGLIPKGIPIGYVSSLQYNEDGLTKKAIIAPYQDLNRLEEVLIIKKNQTVLP